MKEALGLDLPYVQWHHICNKQSFTVFEKIWFKWVVVHKQPIEKPFIKYILQPWSGLWWLRHCHQLSTCKGPIKHAGWMFGVESFSLWKWWLATCLHLWILGVPLTKEPRFHQFYVHGGNGFGLMATHPIAPFVSMHCFVWGRLVFLPMPLRLYIPFSMAFLYHA